MLSKPARPLAAAFAMLAAAAGHSAELADPAQIERYLTGAVEAHSIPGVLALVVDDGHHDARRGRQAFAR